MKHILLVDDVEMIRRDLRSILSADQFVTEEAARGETAVEMVRAANQAGNPFDLVVMDVRMPGGIDGVEAIRRIREFDRSTRIVVYAAYATYADNDLAAANDGDMPLVMLKPASAAMIQAVAAGAY